MNRENAGSAASSGATSNRQPPPQKPKKQSEADFLLEQQTRAKAAMDRTLQEMKQAITNGFKDNAHLTEWMGAYPWVSIGVGLAGGFLAASALTPARDETFQERLRSLIKEVEEKEVDLEKPPRKEKGAERAAKAAVEAQKPTFMASLGSGVFDILKTALVSTLSGAVAGKVADDNDQGPPKDGNGQTAEQPAGGSY
jgi:type IV secretory pathway VirB10-like protein